jgi:hypothetical protein
VGQWVKAIGRWSTKGSTDGEEESGNQGDMPEGKYGGGGQYMIDDGSKSQF